MTSRHLINQQIIELQLDRHEDALKVQQELSTLYWQEIAPAFDKLFDRVAGPDVLVKLDRLEIDLGIVSAKDLHSPKFLEKVLTLLEAAIKNAQYRDLDGVVTQPIHIGRFHLWLYFLEHGYLPANAAYPKPLTEWYSDIFQTLATENKAVKSLSQLVSTCPSALERLILQYDQSFLQQIVVLYTSIKQDRLSTEILKTIKLITHAIQILIESIQKERVNKREIEDTADDLLALIIQLIPSLKKDRTRQQNIKNKLLIKARQIPDPGLALSGWLADNDFLHFIMEQEASPEEIQAIPSRIDKIISSRIGKKKPKSTPVSLLDSTSKNKLLRQLEIEAWRILLNEVIVKGKKATTSGLIGCLLLHKNMQPWQIMLRKRILEIEWKKQVPSQQSLEKKFDNSGLHEVLQKIQQTGQKELLPKDLPSVTEKSFFIPNAGMILLHPFLSTFFQKLDLIEGHKFMDTWHQQKAIFLMHYLSTGEEQSTEFQLVLPKHLMNWPLNMPLDHTISITPDEKTEGENLLQAVTDHWGALGSTSIDGLREGFLQREGKLEKRHGGWFLRVEHNTIDILLGKLPWNLSLIKLPWMEDLLKVEWK